MNKVIKTVLIGPTGAGKSQLCNFIHKDLTNSIYEVSNSLNSCTKEPKSTIVERQDIKLELIDTPGTSDSNNNDEENLKILTKYLRNGKELNQIFLVLSFHDRLSRITRDYLKILSWIFTPKQFMTNLIIIFTHYPDDPDEDDIERYNILKKEVKEELDKIFEIPSEFPMPDIPVYFVNTKIFKKNGNRFFDKNSQAAINDLIEELKLRISSVTYSIIDTKDLDCNKDTIIEKIEKEKSLILKEIEELKRNKEKKEKLIRDMEIEEQRYQNLVSNSHGHRDFIGHGIIGCIGLALLKVASSSCQIF